MERIEKDRIANRVYIGECAGSGLVGRPRKRWTDTAKDCLRKRGLDVRQAMRMVQDRSKWRGFVRNARGIARGINLISLTKCHCCGLSQLYEASELKSVCGRAYNLKGIKGKFSVFLHFLKLCFSFTVAHLLV